METPTIRTETEKAGLMCKNVEHTVRCTFTIALYQDAGETYASWTQTNPLLEPEWAELALYHRGREIGRHKTGKAEGVHNFGKNWGDGYTLAYLADHFEGEKRAFVTTPMTENGNQRVEDSKTYFYKLALGMNGNENAQLTWNSDAAFKPRAAVVDVLVRGEVKEYYNVSQQGRSLDTGIRWGVGLSAVYFADDFSSNRIEIVRTPTTARP